jgi:hypothetical protein
MSRPSLKVFRKETRPTPVAGQVIVRVGNRKASSPSDPITIEIATKMMERVLESLESLDRPEIIHVALKPAKRRFLRALDFGRHIVFGKNAGKKAGLSREAPKPSGQPESVPLKTGSEEGSPALIESLLREGAEFFGSEQSARLWFATRLAELGETARLEEVSLERLQEIERALGQMVHSLPP